MNLMVTPYPPYRDGIAAYAVQEVRQLRADGVDIEVLSPLPSAAHHHLALGGVRGMAALARRATRYESVIIQFSPEMIFGACRTPAQRVAVWAGLRAVASQTKLEIRLHEIEYGPLDRNPAERRMARLALQAADRLTVHTRREVDELVTRIGIDPDGVTVVDHGQAFRAATALNREQARDELGVGRAGHVFLCIGFLQDHKGFDTAVEAFARAELVDQAELHVVGSVRVDHPELTAYARRLAGLCRRTEGVTLHQRYVSDEEFDRWIVAADTVVLPYREIWSSGVMERAKLYDRPTIATDVGGLGDQAPAGTLFFTDTDTLVKAMTERATLTAGRAPAAGRPSAERSATGNAGSPPWLVDSDAPDRDRIEAQIRARVRARQLTEPVEARAGAAVDPLLALGPLPRPHAVSGRPGVSTVKRLIRRVIDWELEPIVTRLDALQRATIEATAELDGRTDPDRSDDPGT